MKLSIKQRKWDHLHEKRGLNNLGEFWGKLDITGNHRQADTLSINYRQNSRMKFEPKGKCTILLEERILYWSY